MRHHDACNENDAHNRRRSCAEIEGFSCQAKKKLQGSGQSGAKALSANHIIKLKTKKLEYRKGVDEVKLKELLDELDVEDSVKS
jgi:hypothetical protein